MVTLNKECYAYPEKLLYPVHTKQAALNSYAQFQKDVQKLSSDRVQLIASNFIKAASLHGITYPQTVQAATDTVSFQTSAGSSIIMSKVASAQDIAKVLDSLQKARHDIPLKDLRKVARYVLQESDKQNLQSQTVAQLYKYAGIGVGDPEQISAQFCKRGQLIRMPQNMKSQFYKAYRDLCDCDEQVMYKKATSICDLMDNIDRMYKLAEFYGTKLKMPQDVCYKEHVDSLITQAQDFLSVPSSSTILSKSALLQRKEAVQTFFTQKYGQSIGSQQQLLSKVSALSPIGLKALIQELS